MNTLSTLVGVGSAVVGTVIGGVLPERDTVSVPVGVIVGSVPPGDASVLVVTILEAVLMDEFPRTVEPVETISEVVGISVSLVEVTSPVDAWEDTGSESVAPSVVEGMSVLPGRPVVSVGGRLSVEKVLDASAVDMPVPPKVESPVVAIDDNKVESPVVTIDDNKVEPPVVAIDDSKVELLPVKVEDGNGVLIPVPDPEPDMIEEFPAGNGGVTVDVVNVKSVVSEENVESESACRLRAGAQVPSTVTGKLVLPMSRS